MALYFLRLVPNISTSFSPYQVVHGWEPTIHLFYEGRTKNELGNLNVAEWVEENCARIEIRDSAVLQQIVCAEEKKKERISY